MTSPIAIATWLRANPDFRERPATIKEFIGPDYLNIEGYVRRRVLVELVKIIGDDINSRKPTRVSRALITGGIGIGKTTIASILLPYMCHWMLCLYDPQKFFGLMPGSRIAMMQMSTSEKQAREVIFQDIKARIERSPWFKKYPVDNNFKNQIRFDNEIWIIPGDSKDTTFEGYNIFGGILDEADSHLVTDNKDYAENGYNTISNRITSRFQDRGFLLVIGQMKSSTGFVSRKFEELEADDSKDSYCVRLAIWESYNEETFIDPVTGKIEYFYYDVKRKQVVPTGVVSLIGEDSVMKIPRLYFKDFKNNPEKALKDLAGMPSAVTDPFISLVTKIEDCRNRWVTRFGGKNPVDEQGKFEQDYRANNTLPRAIHIDLAYSANGDALGLAMGHVREMVKRDGELKPHITIDFLLRKKALPGKEIFIGDIRQIVYSLRDDMKFPIKKISMDGFQSTDTLQQFQRHRFQTELVSIDRDMLPYYDLRDAIYEGRIDFPPYIVVIEKDSGPIKVEILVKELSELMDTGKKIDHPPTGSKDVADAVAGVTFTLMGDRQFKRKPLSFASGPATTPMQPASLNGYSHPALRNGFGAISAPVPPPVNWRP